MRCGAVWWWRWGLRYNENLDLRDRACVGLNTVRPVVQTSTQISKMLLHTNNPNSYANLSRNVCSLALHFPHCGRENEQNLGTVQQTALHLTISRLQHETGKGGEGNRLNLARRHAATRKSHRNNKNSVRDRLICVYRVRAVCANHHKPLGGVTPSSPLLSSPPLA